MTKQGRYEKDDIMPFGKYKQQGKTVMWVIVHANGYMTWAINTIDWFILSNEAYEAYEKFRPERTD